MSEEWVDRLREHTEKVGQAVSNEKWRDSLVVQQRVSCDYCGLIEFTDPFQLQNHQAKCPMRPSVAGENSTCSTCDISFSSVDLKEIHTRVFHQAEEPPPKLCSHNNVSLLCPICYPNIQPLPDLPPFLHQNPYHTDHYKVGDKDLYAHLIESFGLESWLRHVEMECIQYLERARHKGSYREDIEKVKRICERILVETGEKI